MCLKIGTDLSVAKLMESITLITHQALNMRPTVPETLIRNGPELGG